MALVSLVTCLAYVPPWNIAPHFFNLSPDIEPGCDRITGRAAGVTHGRMEDLQ